MNFDQAFTALIGNEGGYSNHKADPGKATMWGITEAVAREAGYTGAMIDLRKDQAAAIYRSNYWTPIKADSLPDQIRFDVFDACVNSGVAQASRWLQRSLGVADDGVIGPVTLAALQKADGDKLLRRFTGQRLLFMTNLSTWPSFGRGWAVRIANNLINGAA
jgi:lysozyme family protein